MTHSINQSFLFIEGLTQYQTPQICPCCFFPVASIMDGMFVSSQNAYIDTLTPNVMLFRAGAFGS